MRRALALLCLIMLAAGLSPAFAEKTHRVDYYYVNYCESCSPEADFAAQFELVTGLSADETDFHAYNAGTDAGREALAAAKAALGLADASLPMAVVDGVAYQGAGQITSDLPKAALSWGLSGDSNVVYLYTPACESCQRARAVIDNLPDSVEVARGNLSVSSKVIVTAIDATQQPETALALFDEYGVPEERRVTPSAFLPGGMALVGADRIEETLPDAVRLGMAVGTVLADARAEAPIGPAAADVAGAAGAGLVAGFNGCALSMLLMFLSALLENRRHSALCAVVFLASKFAAYLLIGFLLLSAMQAADPAWLLPLAKWLLTGLGAALIALNLWDARKARMGRLGEMRNQLPKGMRGRLHRAIRAMTGKRVLIPACALLGMVVAAGEFLCAGQLYLASLLRSARISPGAQWPSLLAYCAAFIAPSAVLAAAILAGRSAEGAAAFMARHICGVKLLTALAMAALIILAWIL